MATANDEAGDLRSPASSPSPDRTGLAATYDAIEAVLLGGGPRYTRLEVAEATGVPIERLSALWRALGFPGTSDDDRRFTDDDIAIIGQVDTLLESGLWGEGDDDLAVVRTLGRTFSRLAEWETGLSGALIGALEPPDAAAATAELLPLARQLHDYVWRRHLAGASARALLGAPAEGAEQCVGFVDIVGFTSTSRKLTQEELGALIERFEQEASLLVSSHGGRVIKTIGDEILFVTDQPQDAAHIALGLVRRHTEDPTFPQVRGGVAHGPVLARLGDVFGETVNIAARLTSLARPGTVLVNPGLAAHLADEFELRRIPAERVRGYHRLEGWVLRDDRAVPVTD